MADGNRINTTGLIPTNNGWAVAEVRAAQDDSGAGEYRVKRQRIVAGPFEGVGSKRLAVQANGGRNTRLEIQGGVLANAEQLV